ncbi:IS91 family transposase [Butyrivibrio proteoclasticus]|uniref:IS91 family transposase n=1 Tax=Butyrivibrio proteoclasticus TaxID=43305 RepID=UPI000687D406|nr:IS91 family transposase [Butyrivibrio proteoclasticus]
MKRNTLQELFLDHYEEIQYTLHPRSSVMENIDKMINCGDPSFGGAMYGCPKCGNFKFVPFRCHSRFCPSCGAKYSIERAQAMSFKLINCKHRHVVFTIAKELRHYFLEDLDLLNCLFDAASSVIQRMFYKMNKSFNFTPGYILVLHTFGRSLQWNPHIHCLLSEGGIGDNGFWRNVRHFNYTFMRQAFRTALLNLMEERITNPVKKAKFKKDKALSYKNQNDGFYIYAKPNLADSKTVAKYIGRYLGRPVIALSRIDGYNKDKDTVTFHYNRHEDDVLVTETHASMDFIKLLIQHIPEKGFKMIRYYGVYARHRESDKKLSRLVHPSKHKILKSFTKWRAGILAAFGYDTLQCPSCNTTMLFQELYYAHKRVSLEDLYEKAMGKCRPKCRAPGQDSFYSPSHVLKSTVAC